MVTETKTDNLCVVCKSNIIETSYKQFDGTLGPAIFGPRGASQWYTVKTYYCPKCGIAYHKLPVTD